MVIGILPSVVITVQFGEDWIQADFGFLCFLAKGLKVLRVEADPG